MRLSIIIPAYNEEKVIGATIERVVEYFRGRDVDFEVIIVDDGSSDATARIAAEKSKQYANIQFIRNEVNRGKGFAVRTGVLAAEGEWILFLDADLSTAPEEFGKFIAHMTTHDIIIGSRAIRGSVITVHQPFFREFIGRLLNKLIRWSVGLPFHDTQCGFKLFHARTKDIFEAQTIFGWLFDVELLKLALLRGHRIREVPVVWQNDPTSAVKTRHIFGIIRELVRITRTHSDYSKGRL